MGQSQSAKQKIQAVTELIMNTFLEQQTECISTVKSSIWIKLKAQGNVTVKNFSALINNASRLDCLSTMKSDAFQNAQIQNELAMKLSQATSGFQLGATIQNSEQIMEIANRVCQSTVIKQIQRQITDSIAQFQFDVEAGNDINMTNFEVTINQQLNNKALNDTVSEIFQDSTVFNKAQQDALQKSEGISLGLGLFIGLIILGVIIFAFAKLGKKRFNVYSKNTYGMFNNVQEYSDL